MLVNFSHRLSAYKIVIELYSTLKKPKINRFLWMKADIFVTPLPKRVGTQSQFLCRVEQVWIFFSPMPVDIQKFKKKPWYSLMANGRIVGCIFFTVWKHYVKPRDSRSGLELVLQCPFPSMITVASQVIPNGRQYSVRTSVNIITAFRWKSIILQFQVVE